MSSAKELAELKRISSRLAAECSSLIFAPPVAAVYNPLQYAFRSHNSYLELAGAGEKKIIFLGMNPGPWGMTQTGVPFGEIDAVRDWLGIKAKVERPEHEHPKRPIEGFACTRSEVSGRRLWGLFKERFTSPKEFFREHFVANYCPLVFMDNNGANITPDKLPKDETTPLYKFCDTALAKTIKLLKPIWLIGIGGFAKKRIEKLRGQFFGDNDFNDFQIAQILHPSPASPKANAGWEKEVIKTMKSYGLWE